MCPIIKLMGGVDDAAALALEIVKGLQRDAGQREKVSQLQKRKLYAPRHRDSQTHLTYPSVATILKHKELTR